MPGIDDRWLALEIARDAEPRLTAPNTRAPVARLPFRDRVWGAELRAGAAGTYDVLINRARWFQVNGDTGEVTEHRPPHDTRALRFSASGEVYYTWSSGTEAGVHWFDAKRKGWRGLPFPTASGPYSWDNALWGREEGDDVYLFANRSEAQMEEERPGAPFARFVYDATRRAWGAAEPPRLSWGARLLPWAQSTYDTVEECDATRRPHALQTSWATWSDGGICENEGPEMGAALWLRNGERWRRWSTGSPWLRLLRGGGERVCAVGAWGGITWVDGRRVRRVDAPVGLQRALHADVGSPRLMGVDLRVDPSGTTLVAAVALLQSTEASTSYDADWLDTAVCVSSDAGVNWRRQTPPRRSATEGRFVDVLWRGQ